MMVRLSVVAVLFYAALPISVGRAAGHCAQGFAPEFKIAADARSQRANIWAGAQVKLKDKRISAAQAQQLIRERGLKPALASEGVTIGGRTFHGAFVDDPDVMYGSTSPVGKFFCLADRADDDKVGYESSALGWVSPDSHAILYPVPDQDAVLVELRLTTGSRTFGQGLLDSGETQWTGSRRFFLLTPQ